jgi:hypothetical protein
MIERLSKDEEELISVRDMLTSYREWVEQYNKSMSCKTIDQQISHKTAQIILTTGAATAHRLDLMHLTMLRILNALEANNASNKREAVEQPCGAAEGEGRGDSQ